MHFPGKKKKELLESLIMPQLPDNIADMIYVEPFGGTFSCGKLLPIKPKMKIYNDIKKYNFDIDADKKEHLDYSEILKKYDSCNTFFYFDPPYYGKEYLYGMVKNDSEFHFKLKNDIKNLKGSYVISYEDVPFINELYKSEFNIKKYSGNNQMFKNEIVITKKLT